MVRLPLTLALFVALTACEETPPPRAYTGPALPDFDEVQRQRAQKAREAAQAQAASPAVTAPPDAGGGPAALVFVTAVDPQINEAILLELEQRTPSAQVLYADSESSVLAAAEQALKAGAQRLLVAGPLPGERFAELVRRHPDADVVAVAALWPDGFDKLKLPKNIRLFEFSRTVPLYYSGLIAARVGGGGKVAWIRERDEDGDSRSALAAGLFAGGAEERYLWTYGGGAQQVAEAVKEGATVLVVTHPGMLPGATAAVQSLRSAGKDAWVVTTGIARSQAPELIAGSIPVRYGPLVKAALAAPVRGTEGIAASTVRLGDEAFFSTPDLGPSIADVKALEDELALHAEALDKDRLTLPSFSRSLSEFKSSYEPPAEALARQPPKPPPPAPPRADRPLSPEELAFLDKADTCEPATVTLPFEQALFGVTLRANTRYTTVGKVGERCHWSIKQLDVALAGPNGEAVDAADGKPPTPKQWQCLTEPGRVRTMIEREAKGGYSTEDWNGCLEGGTTCVKNPPLDKGCKAQKCLVGRWVFTCMDKAGRRHTCEGWPYEMQEGVKFRCENGKAQFVMRGTLESKAPKKKKKKTKKRRNQRN